MQSNTLYNTITQIAKVPEGWMPATRAADVLGKSLRAVQLMCSTGRLVSTKAENVWWVDPNSNATLRLAAGKITPEPSAPSSALAGLSETKREAIYKKYNIVQAYADARENKPANLTMSRLTERFVESWNSLHMDNRTSVRTLLRTYTKYSAGGAVALADNRDYHGPASITPEALEFIVGQYCRQQRPNLASCYERAEAVAMHQGWNLPSLRTVQRLVNERVDPRIITLAREPKKYRDRLAVTATRDWTQIDANQLWVADHRQLDLWVPRLINNMWVWNRPWLTMFLDARTWLPVSWQAAWDSPNAQRVMECFTDAVRKFGCPQGVYLDNGKDFRADRFAGGRLNAKKNKELVRKERVEPLLKLLGIEVHWAIPYNARSKVIEPFFKILAERFDKNFDTYCGNNTLTTPEQIQKLKAEDHRYKLSLTDVQQALDAWITSDYCLRKAPPQSCGGLSVLRAFHELRPRDYQLRMPADEDIAMLLLPNKPCAVKPNGVWVQPLMAYYDSPALDSLRNRRGKKVLVRYNALDPSVVWVFTGESDRFICACGPYGGNAIHPLAETGTADAERLGEVIATRRHDAKVLAGEVQRLKSFAFNAMLSSQAQAAEAKHRHDIESLELADRKTPTVVPFIAGGDMHKAADQGAKVKQQVHSTRRAAASVQDFFTVKTGTGDCPPDNVQPTALDYLVRAEKRDADDNGPTNDRSA